MPYFKDGDEMQSIYQAFFDRLVSHPEVGKALADSGLIIRFKVSEPEGEMIINCREKPGEEGKYLTFLLGAGTVTPDFTISCAADFCHKFWLGKVDIVTSLFSGQAKSDGDFTKAMKLLPVLKNIHNLYRDTLQEIGRADLIVQ